MTKLDQIVIQVSEDARPGSEEMIIVQQHEVIGEDNVITTEELCTGVVVSSLPANEQAAYQTLKSYLQTKLDEAENG